MGCLSSNVIDKSAIDFLDYTPKDSEFEYFRPKGQIIVQIDEMFKVLVVILDFDMCSPKYVRLWHYDCLQRNHFFENLDRVLPPTSFKNSDSGYDTVF